MSSGPTCPCFLLLFGDSRHERLQICCHRVKGARLQPSAKHCATGKAREHCNGAAMALEVLKMGKGEQADHKSKDVDNKRNTQAPIGARIGGI